MKVHFIAIGGSAMHNLALALKNKGLEVTGSDDEIFEPSKSRLFNAGILPDKFGWFSDKITKNIDAVVLGMHAREDNPELIKAKELNLKIFSYPEYLYEQTKDKTRIVIGGSHGKTTITSMIMHVLRVSGLEFDYMVGANVEGFDTMVNLSKTSKYAVFEGDEYLSSPIDRRPKFHLYKPNIAVISGIAWDHINVFPTFDIYKEQFSKFIKLIEPGGKLFYFENDDILKEISLKTENNITKKAYSVHENIVENGLTYLIFDGKKYPIEVFGDHNLQNISAAKCVCNSIGISDIEFYKYISTFKGAAKRLQLLAKNNSCNVYLDFAHSPSKLVATVDALKKQFPTRKLVACMELHTFSSLTKEFLLEYNSTMNNADKAIVYFDRHTVEHKKLPEISKDTVAKSFGREDIVVYNNSNNLTDELLNSNWENTNLLLMSSGSFSGINFKEFAQKIVEK